MAWLQCPGAQPCSLTYFMPVCLLYLRLSLLFALASTLPLYCGFPFFHDSQSLRFRPYRCKSVVWPCLVTTWPLCTPSFWNPHFSRMCIEPVLSAKTPAKSLVFLTSGFLSESLSASARCPKPTRAVPSRDRRPQLTFRRGTTIAITLSEGPLYESFECLDHQPFALMFFREPVSHFACVRIDV